MQQIGENTRRAPSLGQSINPKVKESSYVVYHNGRNQGQVLNESTRHELEIPLLGTKRILGPEMSIKRCV